MKKILLALLALTLCWAAYAKPVDETAAKSIAENFLRRPAAARLTCKGKVPAENKHLRKPLTAAQAAQPAWYVFNFDGGGFVIVSGEDTVEPILGYSKTGRFEYEGAPDNVRWWMDGLASDIAVARSNPALAVSPRNPRGAEPYGNVVKKYTTAKWYQDKPYNNECPTITGGSGRGMTGCVATAGAIVMRYFSWPSAGEGTTQAYSYTNENSKTQNVAAKTLGRTYDWNNMIMDYGGSYTSAQASAVAAIMVDVGVASQMQYGEDGSGTFDENLLAAMQKHFKYNKSAYRACRESYTDDEWISLLKENLDNVGPMPYGGADSEGGHEFVFDGYSDRDYFSVNWGWGGVDDGFFLVSSLVLQGYDFAYDQSSLLGLSPDRTGTSTYTDRLLMFYYSSSYPGLKASTTNFRQNVSFTTSITNLYNDATMPFNGNVYVALYDKYGNKKENVSSANAVSNLENMLIAYTLTGSQPNKDITNISCKITSVIKGGDRLRAYYEGQYSSGFVYGDASNVVWEIIVKEDTGPSAEEIAAGTSLSYDKASKKMTLTCAYDISCKVKNASGAAVISKTLSENTATVLDFSSLAAGTYSIVLSGGEDFTLSFKL